MSLTLVGHLAPALRHITFVSALGLRPDFAQRILRPIAELFGR